MRNILIIMRINHLCNPPIIRLSLLFILGMNSILIYMCHVMIKVPLRIFEVYVPTVHSSVSKKHYSQLAMSLYGVILWTTVAVVLHYKKIFLSI